MSDDNFLAMAMSSSPEVRLVNKPHIRKVPGCNEYQVFPHRAYARSRYNSGRCVLIGASDVRQLCKALARLMRGYPYE